MPILASQDFYLNGATRGAIGGKSRTFFEIKLPVNTVEWYYSFSTTPNVGQKQNTELFSQLTGLLSKSNVYTFAATAIFSPTGNGGACDIYLLDRANLDKFYNKEDLLGNNFTYFIQGSRENYKNGVVQIKDITKGTYYLGFRNSSLSTGTNINVEVVAIVEEIVIDDSWAEADKNQYENHFFNILKKDFDEGVARNVSSCMMDKILKDYSPSRLNGMQSTEKEALFLEVYKLCVSSYQEAKTPTQEKGMTFGNLGWKSYENGDLDKAIEYSEKALTFDNTLGFVKANLGLFYMIKGNESKAIDFYVDAISDIKKDKLTAKRSFIAAIDDVDKALLKNPNLNGFKLVKDMLNDELKNY
jgi:tetratricopeptide (TPR) repeat protein